MDVWNTYLDFNNNNNNNNNNIVVRDVIHLFNDACNVVSEEI